jgi:hypothetical protein
MPRSTASDDEYEPSPGRRGGGGDVIQNMPYDEALELSQESEASSLADGKPSPKAYAGAKGSDAGAKGGAPSPKARGAPASKGNAVFHNNPFDEAEDLDDSANSVSTTEEKQQPGAARGGLQQAATRAQFARAPASRQAVAEAVRQHGDGDDGARVVVRRR